MYVGTSKRIETFSISAKQSLPLVVFVNSAHRVLVLLQAIRMTE